MRINFDFSDLEAFLAVAETGSMQRAAERLAVSQSAITRRIQKLESSLQTRLFERTTRSLKLTLSAKDFRERAQAMLDGARQALQVMGDQSLLYDYQRSAVIGVATISTLTHDLLPRAIQRFRQEGLEARFNILDLFGNEVVDAVLQGDVDFGIGFIGIGEPGLDSDIIGEDPFVLAMRADHELARRKKLRWRELSQTSLIMPSKGSGNRMIIDNALAGQRQDLDWTYQVRHSSTAMGLVEAGVGVAILPASSIPTRSGATIVSRSLVEPVARRTIGTLRRSSQQMSAIADEFYRIVLDEFRVQP